MTTGRWHVAAAGDSAIRCCRCCWSRYRGLLRHTIVCLLALLAVAGPPAAAVRDVQLPLGPGLYNPSLVLQVCVWSGFGGTECLHVLC